MKRVFVRVCCGYGIVDGLYLLFVRGRVRRGLGMV